jgi:hypothetical protein
MAWCSVKAQGQLYLYLTVTILASNSSPEYDLELEYVNKNVKTSRPHRNSLCRVFFRRVTVQ